MTRAVMMRERIRRVTKRPMRIRATIRFARLLSLAFEPVSEYRDIAHVDMFTREPETDRESL